MTEKTKGLSGLALKWIAVVTMFVDHLAIALAGIIPSGAYDGMRIVGRLAFPLFCFLLVEGFYHTGNIRKYLIRLGVFALISEIPFDFLLFGRVVYMGYQNVFFTLFTGLLLLYLYNHFLGNVQPIYAAMTLISMLCLAFVIQCDYGAEGVLLIFLIYFFHYRPVAMMVSIAVVMAVMGGIEPFGILAIVPIAFYNGRRGGRVMEEETNEKDMARDFRKGLAAKYFFYCFYPLHLAVLGVLKYLLH